MDYFTSDLHYFHKGIVESRGFSSMEEMNEAVTDSINATCGEGDTLYLLGDVVWKQNEPRFKELFSSIKARKVLIQGNHDLIGKRGHLSWLDLLDEFHVRLIREFEYGDTKQLIFMDHYPVAHWYQQHRSSWHLHGHLHGSPSLVPGKILDVGWDIYKRPISYKEIKNIMDMLPVRANHHHGAWFE